MFYDATRSSDSFCFVATATFSLLFGMLRYLSLKIYAFKTEQAASVRMAV